MSVKVTNKLVIGVEEDFWLVEARFDGAGWLKLQYIEPGRENYNCEIILPEEALDALCEFIQQYKGKGGTD